MADEITNEAVEQPVSEETSLRDSISKAFDDAEAAGEPVHGDTAPEAKPGIDAGTEQPTNEGRSRDALGRFAPRGDKAAETPETGAALAPQDPAAPVAPSAEPGKFDSPPASWSATEREHWAKMPEQAREAVMRREVEVQRALQGSVTARRGLQAMQEVIAPYLPNINAANNGDVVGAIRTFFDYDNRLRHGSQIEKARAVTALIRGYGVDIEALDAELAGAQHAPGTTQQAELQAALARELAPYREFIAQQRAREAAQAQGYQQQLVQGVEQFRRAVDASGKPAHPYFDVVRNDMADLIDVAEAQGRQMTFAEAYDRACWQNPDIRSKLLAAQAQSAGQASAQAAQRARSAAVSVRSSPRVTPPATPSAGGRDDRSSDIRAALASLEGQE